MGRETGRKKGLSRSSGGGPWATSSASCAPDVTVLAFAGAFALGTALLSGLIPALQTARIDVNRTVKADGGGAVRSRV